jgi:hypothetical protein
MEEIHSVKRFEATQGPINLAQTILFFQQLDEPPPASL